MLSICCTTPCSFRLASSRSLVRPRHSKTKTACFNQYLLHPRTNSSRKDQRMVVVRGATALRDTAALVAVFATSFVWGKMFEVLQSRGVMAQNLSRKLTHITSGPIFCGLWLLYSDAPHARYLAILLPCLQIIRLMLVGTGLTRDRGLVKSITRKNDHTEVLRGPLFYTIILTWVTWTYWRQSFVGLVTVSMMCGGDGLADIIGRRIGKHKWPYNKDKSVEGSCAMFAGGIAMSTGLLALFQWSGYMAFNTGVLYIILASALTSTIVESIGQNRVFDDNLTVPITAAATAHMMMGIM